MFFTPNVGKLERQGNIQGLLRCLEGEDAQLKRQSIQALGRLKAYEALMPYLDDECKSEVFSALQPAIETFRQKIASLDRSDAARIRVSRDGAGYRYGSETYVVPAVVYVEALVKMGCASDAADALLKALSPSPRLDGVAAGICVELILGIGKPALQPAVTRLREVEGQYGGIAGAHDGEFLVKVLNALKWRPETVDDRVAMGDWRGLIDDGEHEAAAKVLSRPGHLESSADELVEVGLPAVQSLLAPVLLGRGGLSGSDIASFAKVFAQIGDSAIVSLHRAVTRQAELLSARGQTEEQAGRFLGDGLHVLQGVGSAASRRALGELLGHPNEDVRWRTAVTFRDEAALGSLEAYLVDNDPERRSAAASAILRIIDTTDVRLPPSTVDALVVCLDDHYEIDGGAYDDPNNWGQHRFRPVSQLAERALMKAQEYSSTAKAALEARRGEDATDASRQP